MNNLCCNIEEIKDSTEFKIQYNLNGKGVKIDRENTSFKYIYDQLDRIVVSYENDEIKYYEYKYNEPSTVYPYKNMIKCIHVLTKDSHKLYNYKHTRTNNLHEYIVKIEMQDLSSK